MKKPKYSILKQAGSGSYGSVLKAIDNDNCKLFNLMFIRIICCDKKVQNIK